MIQQLWQDLISQNPMLIEITRFRRRYLSFSRGNSMNGILLALILICYVGLVLVVSMGRESIPPIAVIYFETGLLCLFAPLMLYQAISGERERRSWDLLLAAPITKPQIVVGKFIGAMAALGVAALLFVLPLAILELSYKGAKWGNAIEATLVSLSFLTCVCALTILFSARVKRSLMALGASLGTLMVVLIVIPALATTGGGSYGDRSLVDLTLYLHPFHVLGRIGEIDQVNSFVAGGPMVGGIETTTGLSPAWWGWPQIAVYLALAAVLLGWASNTLNFAENEVKFLPQGHKDA